MTGTARKLWLAPLAGIAVGVLLFAGCSDAPQSRGDTSQRPSVPSGTAKASEAAKASETARPVADGTSPTRPVDEPVTKTAAPRSKSAREITFDTIKFDIEKGQPFERSMLTKVVEKLDGQRVRIRGYMLPSFQQSGIKQFVLVRDNMQCCFGPSAALYDCIIVEMVNDQSCEFSVRPIAVEGTFAVREFKGPDDTHLAIYHLDGERVR
jgi:hypothetical protein